MNTHLTRCVLPTNRREKIQYEIIDALETVFRNAGYDVNSSDYGLNVPLKDDEYVVQIVVIVERKQ